MSDLEIGREIAGRYRVVRFIGRGGMGAVYEVEHAHTGQRLAMKVLTARQQGQSVERFKREARAASRIQSDHVVRVTDADVAPELDGAPFLVMELLDGADLEHATGGKAAAPGDVLTWLRQVARALSKAHEAGIVHRDLKPENLFLTRREDGTPLVKILDFGIAKVAEEGGSLTQSDQFLGTPIYMSPEQTGAQGEPVTARSDVFALGLIAFRLLVGRTYWRDGSLQQVISQILVEPIVPASQRGSQLGPGFDGWFQRSCARDPARRFESVAEQVEALAVALGLPAEPRAPTPPSTAKAIASSFESAPTVSPEAPTLGASSVEPRPASTGRARQTAIVASAVALVVVAAVTVVMRSGAPPAAPASSAAGLPSVPPIISASLGATTAMPSAPVVTLAPVGMADAAASVATAPAPTVTPRAATRPAPAASTKKAKDPLDGQY